MKITPFCQSVGLAEVLSAVKPSRCVLVIAGHRGCTQSLLRLFRVSPQGGKIGGAVVTQCVQPLS
jgi:hypothetical protein